MRKKILFVFGTRPEAIKMAPLVKEVEAQHARFDSRVCVTGQHREMLDQVLEIFQIQPDFDLDIMKPGQDLYDVSAKVLLGLRDVLSSFAPDYVLVHGDTATSSMAALAAYYQQIAVGHVEAGLRTNNIYSPWPEEINRQLTGRIATLHFAPTLRAKQNLIKENICESKVIVTGNTVIDALHFVRKKIDNDLGLAAKIRAELMHDLPWLKDSSKRFVLVTGHRRENFGSGFLNICEALKKIAEMYPGLHIVYPVHLNPNVQQPVNQMLANTSNIHLLAPLGYLPFIYLMNKSYLVLTDSGGIQEEAPGLGKPVLVMRDTTERPEAVEAGTVKLVGTECGAIVEELKHLLDDDDAYRVMSHANNPFGDGKAAEQIAEVLYRE